MTIIVELVLYLLQYIILSSFSDDGFPSFGQMSIAGNEANDAFSRLDNTFGKMRRLMDERTDGMQMQMVGCLCASSSVSRMNIAI